jgi:transposase
MKKLYGGIDLHGHNSVVVVLDEADQVLYQKRLPNELAQILPQLAPFRTQLQGLVVESTYNWYWLVDGLQEAGYVVHLANPAAMQQYAGLKYTNDDSDARWLAHLLRLEVLPTGYIYPKEDRAIRDLLRKRSQLVRQKTANLLSIQNLLTRNTGQAMRGNQIKQLTPATIGQLVSLPEHALALQVTVAVMQHLTEQITQVERAVHARVKLRPAFQALLTVPGIGQTLALTIMLETGEIHRFPTVGQFASYCRCVGSIKLSNGKRKGQGNTKNGNKYLAWAFVEAAHFAIRYEPQIAQFYQRKRAKTKVVVALKAVAHKLARACYYLMRDTVPFDVTRAFA